MQRQALSFCPFPITVAVGLLCLFGCQVGLGTAGDDDDSASASVFPTLTDIEVDADYKSWKLDVEFHWTDANHDVREGALYVTVDGESIAVYDLPHASVSLLSDEGEARLDLTPFAVDGTVELGLVLEDKTGNQSEPVTHVVNLGRTFFFEEEPDDTEAEAQSFGYIDFPAAVRGDLSLLSDDMQGEYTGDLDYYRFVVDGATDVTFTLWWPYDYNDLGMELLNSAQQVITFSDEHSLISPEHMGSPLQPGVSYFVMVAGVSGAPTDYVLLINESS